MEAAFRIAALAVKGVKELSVDEIGDLVGKGPFDVRVWCARLFGRSVTVTIADLLAYFSWMPYSYALKMAPPVLQRWVRTHKRRFGPQGNSHYVVPLFQFAEQLRIHNGDLRCLRK